MDKHKSQTLIDHELLTAPTPNGDLKRVAAFGWYAGGQYIPSFPIILTYLQLWEQERL